MDYPAAVADALERMGLGWLLLPVPAVPPPPPAMVTQVYGVWA